MNLEINLPSELRATMEQILADLEALKSVRPRALVTIEGRVALSVARSAETLDLSEYCVRKLLGSGALRGKKSGGIWLVPAEEIERFLGLKKDTAA